MVLLMWIYLVKLLMLVVIDGHLLLLVVVLVLLLIVGPIALSARAFRRM